MAVEQAGEASEEEVDGESFPEIGSVELEPVEPEFSDDEEDEADDLAPPEEALRTFTNAMAKFARRRSNYDASGVIPALIGAVVADGEDGTPIVALHAVCNLIRENDVNRGAAHDAGAVGYTIALLNGRPAEIVAAAAQCLCHLGAGPDIEKPSLVRLGGAIPSLVDGPVSAVGENPEAAYWAAGALRHIASANNAGRSAVAAAERCLPLLVQMLDFAVPWVAGMDSPRRTSQPTPMHKRASVSAAEALAAVMASADGADAVSDAVAEAAQTSPRIGQAISSSSKRLLALLQACGRERLAAAQVGSNPEVMKEAVMFARAVLVPKSESGAARHYFTAAQRLVEDKKKHPWRYGEDGHGKNEGGAAIQLPSPRAPVLASPRGARATSPLAGPRASSPSRGGGVVPPSPRGASASSPRGSTTPRAASPGRGAMCQSPSIASSSPAIGGRKSGWQTAASTSHAEQGGGVGGAVAPPPPLSIPPSTPRGLEEGYALSEVGDSQRTGEFRLRSRTSPPPAYAMARSGRGGIQNVTAAAEERMESQLAAVRAVLSDAMAGLQQEHEGTTSQLKSDNRKLQHALAVARAREADLEEKLKRAQAVMSGLTSDWNKVR